MMEINDLHFLLFAMLLMSWGIIRLQYMEIRDVKAEAERQRNAHSPR